MNKYALLYDSTKPVEIAYSIIEKTDEFSDEYTIYLSDLPKDKAKELCDALEQTAQRSY